MSEKNTIICTVADHAGQINLDSADEEIQRQKTEKNEEYVKDISPYLRDDDPEYPGVATLVLGYCWLVKKHVSLNPIL